MLNIKTLLVDGSYLLKRSFLGTPNVVNKSGHIGGLYAFMTTLRKIIIEQAPNKIIVFFDGDNSGKMRYDIYPAYKANRKGKHWYNKLELSTAQIKIEEDSEKSFLKQKVRIQQYLEELFIRQLEVDETESDDLIAFYCKEFHKEETLVIYSNDRDYCQLLDYPNVSLYLANKHLSINKNSYFLYFKHHYSNACLMKTICGCDVDNIGGIKGVGEETLLKYFPKLKKEKLLIPDIIKQAKILQEERVTEKKKPLAAINNIINGKKVFDLNFKLVNLIEPLLSTEAKKELRNIQNSVLDDADRGSKNLMKLMIEDEFFSIYQSDFMNYVTPFFGVINKEKEKLKQYKNGRRN